MKIGDVVPSRQVHKACPVCGDNVFKSFRSGYYIISSVAIAQTPDGFLIRDQWHCPACGHKGQTTHERLPSGVMKPRRTDSSDKSKSKRSKRT